MKEIFKIPTQIRHHVTYNFQSYENWASKPGDWASVFKTAFPFQSERPLQGSGMALHRDGLAVGERGDRCTLGASVDHERRGRRYYDGPWA